MKKAVPLLLLVLALALVAFFLARAATQPSSSQEGALSSNAPESTPPTDVDPVSQATVATRKVAPQEETPEPASDAPTTEIPPEPIDREETRPLRVRVLDRFGTPIPRAEVLARGLRTVQSPGDAYWWEGPQAMTDTEGRAELHRPVWQGTSGGDWQDVASIRLFVKHADYITLDDEVTVGDEEIVLTLLQGAFLIVSGWIDSPGETIVEVRPELSYGASVSKDDWVPLRDGRPSCNKIPPGKHALRLKADRDGITYSSEGIDFELVESEQQELHLQLLPPTTIRGVLDPAVPRPVVGGLVRAGAQHLGDTWNTNLLEIRDATVAADGTFLFEGLPPGKVEIIGLCDGWSSDFANSDADEQALQSTDSANDGEFVLHMRRTAHVEVTVLDPEGAPFQGARVVMWPNVHWASGFSNIFLDQEWTAVTNANGTALLSNLPANLDEGVAVIAKGFQMALDEGRGRRQAWVDLGVGMGAAKHPQRAGQVTLLRQPLRRAQGGLGSGLAARVGNMGCKTRWQASVAVRGGAYGHGACKQLLERLLQRAGLLFTVAQLPAASLHGFDQGAAILPGSFAFTDFP